MNAQQNNNDVNSETPAPKRDQDAPAPAGRIEMGTPEIDITSDQLGALFSERRRALGLKIEEVAEDIKIKPEYIRAIEREEFDDLPTPQYARLFVRAYAERLGFNVSEVYALLDVNVPDLAAKGKLRSMTMPVREGGLSGPLPGTQATYPKPAKKAAKSTIIWWALAIAIIALTVTTVIILTQDEPAETGDAQPTEEQNQQTAVPPVTSEMNETVSEPIETPSEPAPMHLTVRFDQQTWARLSADGILIDDRNYYDGDVLSAPATDSFHLSLGHIVGVVASVNDVPLNLEGRWTDEEVGYLMTRDSLEHWLDTSWTHTMSPREQPVVSGEDVSSGVR